MFKLETYGMSLKSTYLYVFIDRSFLSSFLPQDRVSEFAAMTPQDLLKETQRAAGDENLTKWHSTLISAGKEQRDIQQVRCLAINKVTTSDKSSRKSKMRKTL